MGFVSVETVEHTNHLWPFAQTAILDTRVDVCVFSSWARR